MSSLHLFAKFYSPQSLLSQQFVYILLLLAIAAGLPALAQTNTGILQSVSCSSASMTGAGSDPCTIKLKYPAQGTSPFVLSVSSSNAAVSVPANVSIAGGASSGTFTAKTTAVSSVQTATISVKAWNSPVTFAVQVSPAKSQTTTPTLSINATSIAFGNVSVGDPATQTITTTAQGGTVQITSATVSGTGFSLAKTSFPISLSAGQSASLNVAFAPTSTGTATGQVSIVSNSGSSVVKLSGTAVTASTYKVDLSWNAAATSTPAVAGYDIFRAPSGSSSYQELNSSLNQGTSYVDSGVQVGQTYQYYVVSVDTNGKASSPSTPTTVIVP